MKNLSDLLSLAKEQVTMKLVIASAEDEDVLKAVISASDEDIIEPILVGDEEKIAKILEENGKSRDKYKIINASSLEDSAKISVKLVADGEGDFLMKGLIDTSILLKAVLNKEEGLRTDSLLSHVMLYDVPSYDRLLFLTDGGMNIAPDVNQKAKILQNAVIAAKSLKGEGENVNVAVICAKEKVNPKMQATVDAAELTEMSKNGDFGENVIVEGPIAIDLAFSKKSCEVKGYKSEISERVDVLLVPTIEVGNGIGKSLTYLANAKSAGIIMGAKKPVVLVSRADDYETKLSSIALGSVIASSIK